MFNKIIFTLLIIILCFAGCATDTPDRENVRETEASEVNPAPNLENFGINEADGSEDGETQKTTDVIPNEREDAEPDDNEPSESEPSESEPEANGPEIIGSAAEPPADNEIPYIDTARPDGFVFVHNGADVVLGAFISDVLNALGPERDYYEYPSCAFEGDARIFVYDGFEIATYQLHTKDYDRLYSVTFFDDGAATAEGVRIGQSYADMAAAYGADCEEIPGSYLYEKNGTILSFSVENGVITVITYFIAHI